MKLFRIMFMTTEQTTVEAATEAIARRRMATLLKKAREHQHHGEVTTAQLYEVNPKHKDKGCSGVNCEPRS